jgi:Domain of unknown function (DUF1707)
MSDLRASDADRERTADVLRDAAAEGRLTVEELDERLHDAYRGVTRAQLEALVADVRAEGAGFLPAGPATAGGTGGARVAVRRDGEPAERIVSVLGGANRKGRWRVAPLCRVTNVLGGADLDLTEAQLGADVVEMRVFSLLGGADLRLPEHLNVEVSEMSFLGGNDISLGEARPDPGGPVLRLRLVSILGGTDVTRGAKPSMREKWAAHRGGDHRAGRG